MKKLYFLLSLIGVFTFSTGIAQQKSVSGTITDETGQPLPGATVVVEGTTRGVSTDFDGNYTIDTQEGEVLVVSYIGYADQQITVGSADSYSISLGLDNELEEVIVTSLGQSKELRQLGYSAQAVSTDDITNSSENNIVNALNGKVAGVNIVSSSGGAGASANITIRGSSSVLGNNQPLFVIDGIPVDNSTDSSNDRNSVSGISFRDYGKVVGSNRAADINPEDIESLTVLKGGAATALYGLRAVNGAIIITTKSGKGTDGFNANFSSEVAFEEVNKYPGFTEKYARGRNGLYSNVTHWSWGPAYASNPTFPTGTTTDLNGDGTITDVTGQPIPIYRDNYKNFFQRGTRVNLNASVSKSGELGSFYISAGNASQESIVKNNTYNRTNLTFKGNYNITERFKIGALATYSNVKTVNFQGGDTGIGAGLTYWHHMWDLANRPWIDSNSERTWFSAFVPDPNWIVNEEGENAEVDRIIGNLNASYEVASWLKINLTTGIDTFSDNRKLVRPISSVNTVGRLGDLYEIKTNSKDFTFNLNGTGSVDLTEGLNLSYLGGLDVYDRQYDRLYVEGTELLVKNFNDISNAKNYTAINSDANKRIIGLFGEVNFAYQNYLFLSITGRNDWSSTLPKKNNSFFYPSVSAGFVFSELIDNAGFLNFGKIKGSWSKLGNDAPVYSTNNIFARITPNVNLNQPQFTISTRQNNPDIKPELSTAWEAGVELTLFDRYLKLDATYYKRNTVDQVLPVPLSSTTGFTEFINNSGEVENSGIELVVGLNDILRSVSQSLKWDLNLNFSKNENKVVSVPEGLEEIIIGYGYWNTTKLVARPGLPLGTFVGNGYKRNASGVLLLDDQGQPQVAEDQVLGDYNPDWTLNILPTISYKGLSLNANLEFKEGGTLYNDAEVSWIYSGLSATTGDRFYSATDVNANATKIFDGVIESSGQRSTIAVPLTNTYYHQIYNNIDENFAEDSSWIRLRSISLSYDLPSSLLENTFIKSLRITASGRNLWLKTDYSGIDPETGALGAGNVQGFNTITTPNSKSYGLKLNLQF